MLHRDEVEAALTRLGIAATRRISADQVDRLVTLWIEELRDVEPIGFRRAAHAYVQEGKWPTVGEFRTRAKGMTPLPVVTGHAAPDDSQHGRCRVGHAYVIREFTNPGGRKLGGRPWCPCEDRAAAFYGHTWGDELEYQAGRWVAVERYAAAVA